jgi:hypothetical protein
MSVNKIRKLYDKLFDSCPEISKVGVWVIHWSHGVTVLDEDYEINEKSLSEIYYAKENIDIINDTISVFRDYDATEGHNIMQQLEELKKTKMNIHSSKMLNAMRKFDFAVDVEPFKKYLGARFPWEIIKIGVWFEIYRDGKIVHYIDWKKDDEEDEKVEVKKEKC